MVTYRGVTDTEGRMIAFGVDDNQSGAYHDMGTWCDFTFTSFPATEVVVPEGKTAFLFKTSSGLVVVRTQEEVDADLVE